MLRSTRFASLALTLNLIWLLTTTAQDSKSGPRQSERGKSASHRVDRLTSLIKVPVKNVEGKQLGFVKDLVLGLDSGVIRYAALSDGGLLGFADKLLAVPWDALTFQHQGDEKYLIVDISEEEFAKTPGFNKDKWPEFGDPRWRKGTTADASTIGVRTESGQNDDDADGSTTWCRLTEIPKLPMKDQQGNNMGSLIDLLSDLKTGKIRYAIMSSEKSLRAAGFRVVPWTTLTWTIIDAEAPVFLLHLNEDQFRDAPAFAEDNWPSFDDHDWSKSIDAYYTSARIVND